MSSPARVVLKLRIADQIRTRVVPLNDAPAAGTCWYHHCARTVLVSSRPLLDGSSVSPGSVLRSVS